MVKKANLETMIKKEQQSNNELRLTIKNMVCPRCVMAVEQIFREAGIVVESVVLGTVTLKEQLNYDQKSTIEQHLVKMGFEIIRDNKEQSVERIKSIIIDLIRNREVGNGLSLRMYLQQQMLKEYSTLTRMFSYYEGITIERYYNLQRIEKAKELLQYNQQTIKEIAYDLGFSSSQHFSSNFKEYTGQTPQEFRLNGTSGRLPLDGISGVK